MISEIAGWLVKAALWCTQVSGCFQEWHQDDGVPL
jgi:hypothetical protein